jgi:small subunit ribosomal protein S8
MLHDVLADALSKIKNAEKIGKESCIVKASKLVKHVLQVLKDDGYIKNFEFINDGKSGQFKVNLIGKIIDCNVIKPRSAVKIDEIEKYEKRFLPGRGYGILILTTPKGVLDHRQARLQKTGGRLVAFCY